MVHEFPNTSSSNKPTDAPSLNNGDTAFKATEDGSIEDDASAPPTESSGSRLVELMTFTSVKPNCDCDECCTIIKRGTVPSQVPETFRSAVNEYKRRKLAEVPMRRTQVRTLLGRGCSDDAVAVWQWIMPPSAEPLVEFGNPLIHRIIWIQRLHRQLILKHVGTGILGSHEEEQGRKQLDWVEDDVILVSSDGKRSSGYVVENIGNLSNTPTISHDAGKPDVDEIIGPAVLYVAKVHLPLESISNHVESLDEERSSTRPAFDVIRRVCIRSILSRSDNEADGQNAFKIDCTNKELFRRIILDLVNEAQIII